MLPSDPCVQAPWAAQEPASGTVLVHRNDAAAPRPDAGLHRCPVSITSRLLIVLSTILCPSAREQSFESNVPHDNSHSALDRAVSRTLMSQSLYAGASSVSVPALDTVVLRGDGGGDYMQALRSAANESDGYASDVARAKIRVWRPGFCYLCSSWQTDTMRQPHGDLPLPLLAPVPISAHVVLHQQHMSFGCLNMRRDAA